jgi:membrane-associated phospholipid phosphatase
MCGAAVYLDHHWILDVVVGVGYALVVFAVFRMLLAGPKDGFVSGRELAQ